MAKKKLTEKQAKLVECNQALFDAAELYAKLGLAKQREPDRLRISFQELGKAAINWYTAATLAKREAGEAAHDEPKKPETKAEKKDG